MADPTSPAEYLVISRGQWDPDASPAQIQAAIDAFYVWHARMTAEGKMKPGKRLAPEGRLVSRQAVTDGPFAEAKEVVGGYWFITAGSLDEAAQVAAGNPCLAHGLRYEIRPTDPERASAYAQTTETPKRDRSSRARVAQDMTDPKRSEGEQRMTRDTAMILDHIGFQVSDLAKTRAFLVDALKPLDIGVVAEGEGWAMLGRDGKPQFWFGAFGPPPGPIHVAFAAANRAQVRQFHAAALAAGGKDNGAPGLRPQYHPDYYGAFVIGPDGHNIEAVCHDPER